MTTTRSKPLTILLITLLCVGLIIFILIRPVFSSIVKSWKELKSSESNLQNAGQLSQIMLDLRNQNITQVADNAQKFIPSNQESGQLVIDLTTMAQTNNLTVEQTTIDKSKQTTKTDETTTPTPKTTSTTQTNSQAKNKVENVDFTMKLSGNFVDFAKFLQATESSSRLIVFKNISIQTEQNTENKSTLGAQISGTAYYKKEVSLENNMDNLKVSQEAIDMFLNLRNTIQATTQPSDGSFGRTNPFESY